MCCGRNRVDGGDVQLSKDTERPNPSITVILPVYNGQDYLRQTLDSITRQTFQDLEILCVNDGSTDETLAILNACAARDDRVRIHSQQNSGPGAARNAGLDLARGTYVMMLDADDLYSSQLVECLYEQARATDADVVVCASSQFDNVTSSIIETPWALRIEQIPVKEVFSYHDMPDFLFTAFMGWPWDKLYKRSFIEENQLRFPVLSNCEDLSFVYLSLARAERVSVVDKVLVRHRVNRSGSVSTSRARNPLDFYESICLLKAELKKDPLLYSKVSWSFLNWAFEYSIWNIETIGDLDAQTTQLRELARGGLSELEVTEHSPAFFSLDPSAIWRYKRLLRASRNGRRTRLLKSSFLVPRLLKLASRMSQKGVRSAITTAATWIIGRLPHKSERKPSPASRRGTAFIPGK